MLLPLYLLLVLGRSPGGAGLLLAFLGLGTLPFALLGTAGLSTVLLCAALLLRGAGLGMVYAPSIAAAYSTVPKPMIPAATTSFNIAQRLGGPAATTLLAIALHYNMQKYTGDAAAFSTTFWLLCSLHLAGVFAALRLPQHKGSSAQSAAKLPL